jgi:hypothetical protein
MSVAGPLPFPTITGVWERRRRVGWVIRRHINIMTWLAINNISLIKRFAARGNYANSCGTVRALCTVTVTGTMAGLGLFDQKSVRALIPRGLLRSAYDFLCLIYAKSPRASWKVPGQFRPTLGATRKKTFFGPPARLW